MVLAVFTLIYVLSFIPDEDTQIPNTNTQISNKSQISMIKFKTTEL